MRAPARYRLFIWRLLGLAVTGAMVLTLGLALQAGAADSERQIDDRFAARGQLAATFVSTWTKQTFADERRVTQANLQGDVDLDEKFRDAASTLGFPAAVLLDSDGRALAVYPPASELIGTHLDLKYAHLAPPPSPARPPPRASSARR